MNILRSLGISHQNVATASNSVSLLTDLVSAPINLISGAKNSPYKDLDNTASDYTQVTEIYDIGFEVAKTIFTMTTNSTNKSLIHKTITFPLCPSLHKVSKRNFQEGRGININQGLFGGNALDKIELKGFIPFLNQPYFIQQVQGSSKNVLLGQNLISAIEDFTKINNVIIDISSMGLGKSNSKNKYTAKKYRIISFDYQLEMGFLAPFSISLTENPIK